MVERLLTVAFLHACHATLQYISSLVFCFSFYFVCSLYDCNHTEKAHGFFCLYCVIQKCISLWQNGIRQIPKCDLLKRVSNVLTAYHWFSFSLCSPFNVYSLIAVVCFSLACDFLRCLQQHIFAFFFFSILAWYIFHNCIIPAVWAHSIAVAENAKHVLIFTSVVLWWYIFFLFFSYFD